MTTIDSASVYRYAKIAQLAYYINDESERGRRADELAQLGCNVDFGSVRSETSWKSFKFDAFQAICATYNDKLVVAYRGTNNKRVEDLTVDAGIINVCSTPTSGAMLRSLIERATGKKTWSNWFRSTSIRMISVPGIPGQISSIHIDGLAGRLLLALEYYNNSVSPRRNQFGEIVVVGHSLGGLIASHVAYKNDAIAHAFDSAPGVKYTLAENSQNVDGRKASKIFNHRTVGDPISGPPGMLNDQGYPYGHMGHIFNWKSPNTCSGFGCHDLIKLIDTQFDHSRYLEGSAEAPTTGFFW
ncbi:MAG: hypothetical protein MH825_13815 [Cyanobacteria bacterium]|nr:hypothetical protein [Cyanobacteriota bacterium]